MHFPLMGNAGCLQIPLFNPINVKMIHSNYIGQLKVKNLLHGDYNIPRTVAAMQNKVVVFTNTSNKISGSPNEELTGKII